MEKKKRRIPAPVIEITIVVVLALLVWIFVDVSIESVIQNKGGSCITVVFDKPAVKGADRIVIHKGDQVITITDKETVRQIADLYVVANRTALCGYQNSWRMEIYNGDRLVREVVENCCGGLYEIYEADLLHWIFPLEGKTGQVELTQEEHQWLENIVEQYS